MEPCERLEESEAEAELDRLLAIQPVYARNLDVKAFELLLEQAGGTRPIDAIQAISQVVIDSYTTLYQNGRTQSLPCFLRLDEETLFDADLSTFPRQHFILEVPGDIRPSAEVCERLRELARMGYLLSLSEYHSHGPTAGIETLLNIVHIVRVDIASHSREDLEAILNELKPYNLDLLAENLNGKEQFRFCLDAGFHYFHGELLGKPRTIKDRRPQNNKLLLLQLMSELEDPQTNLERLEQICLQDADLTYKFIKVVNSAIYGMETEIETLSHALALLGTRQIRHWASMFLLEGHSDKPQDLVRVMLVRGRMCETLAELTGCRNPVSYFIVGLLSKLDVLTDIAMPDLMNNVPLKREIKEALLEGRGSMGVILREVENYEQGRFDQLRCLSDRSFYETTYRHSLGWARKLQASVG